jgi:hypothetical protein
MSMAGFPVDPSMLRQGDMGAPSLGAPSPQMGMWGGLPQDPSGMNPWAGMVPILEQNPPLPPKPSKDFLEKAQKYISDFCLYSKYYVDTKRPRLELMWKLYNGKIGIREWRAGGTTNNRKPDLNDNARRTPPLYDDMDDLSDFVYPIQPLVNAQLFNAYLSIFSGPEYLIVTSEDDRGSSSLPMISTANGPEFVFVTAASFGLPSRKFGLLDFCVDEMFRLPCRGGLLDNHPGHLLPRGLVR